MREVCTIAVLIWLWNAGVHGIFAREMVPAGSNDAWETYQILQRSCARCHGGQIEKPKGGFGYVLDLPLLVDRKKYVVAGKPEKSEIYLSITDPDPEFRMPPPDSDAPPLNEREIAMVKRWIEGAAGGSASAPAGSEGATGANPPVTEGTIVTEPGRLHPLLVHFPISLLLTALICETGRILLPRIEGFAPASRLCLWLAASGAAATVVTGWIRASEQGYTPDNVFDHRCLGIATAALATGCLVAFEFAVRLKKKWHLWLMRILLAAAVIFVTAAGYTGGELVHGRDYFW
jgi:uncharacterized membrane protein/mono/diheme cytochrome c family protein